MLCVALAMLFGLPWSARAQAPEYPARPVTIMVPFTAGGPSDVAMRVLAEELQKIWNQRVLVENRPGGGTVIGTAAAARAAPDGYTLAFAGGSFVVNAAVRRNLPFDTLGDFRGISVVADSPIDIVVSRNSPAQTLQDLLAMARTRDLTYATAGPGSIAHMTGELLARETGIRITHIPYPGDAAAFSDVVAGRVDFRIGSWSDDRQHVANGVLRLLAAVYPRRLPEAASAPTVAEVVPSMANYPLGVFNAVVVPARTPGAIVERLSDSIRQAVATEAFRDRFATLGLYPRFTTPAETDAFLRAQVETWTAIARSSGIEIQ
jgi:tripartite-type tricarboxylate transporter receptor subunit TctC